MLRVRREGNASKGPFVHALLRERLHPMVGVVGDIHAPVGTWRHAHIVGVIEMAVVAARLPAHPDGPHMRAFLGEHLHPVVH